MNKRSCIVMAIIFLSLLVIQTNCRKKSPTQPKNQIPIIHSLTANPDSLDWRQMSQLVVVASDPEGGILNYTWSASGGEFMTATTKDTVTWKAPDSSGICCCMVTVDDGEDSTSKSIDLKVNEHPLLSLNKDSLRFDANISSLGFSITNLGTGVLDWSVASSTDDGGAWIKSLTPSQGIAATNETDQVVVEVDRTNLSDGAYTGKITVSSDGGNADIAVTMQVLMARLSVSPTFLNFGETTTSLNFEISNEGSGTLSWTISENEDCISVYPTTGETTTEKDQVTVTANRSVLALGETKTCQINVTSNGGTENITVTIVRPPENIIFADDFSGDLSQWIKQYCDAWISNGEVHVKGNTSGYYGTFYHSFSPYVSSEYTIKMKLARVSYAGSDDYYGLYTRVNDVGDIALTNLWFLINPGGGSENWAIWSFLSAGSSSGWYLLASDSRGYSNLIISAANQWNDIIYTITDDKTLIVKIGDTELYRTNEIRNIESSFGITISVSLVSVGIRTLDDFEVKADDVVVSQPGFMLADIKTELPRSSPGTKEVNNVIHKDRPENLGHLPTLMEVLKKVIHK